MSRFVTELDCHLRDDCDRVWILDTPLIYESDLAGPITAPAGFQTDLASVPRWIPIASNALMGMAHRESVIHDLLYRSDATPSVSRLMADRVFLEAMIVRKKNPLISIPMFLGVRIGGIMSFHRRRVGDVI